MGEAVTDGPGAWGTLVGSAGRTRSSPVAQLAEHATVNRRVIGSSPIGGAKLQLSAVRSPAQESGPTLYPQFRGGRPARGGGGGGPPRLWPGGPPARGRGGAPPPRAA